MVSPDSRLKMKEVSDEASVKSSNVTWSTKKKQIADRVEKISSKFEEIQRAIRPSENVSSSNSNDTILDSPTRNKIIEEEIRKYELQIANNFPSPNVSTPEPENFNGQHFHTHSQSNIALWIWHFLFSFTIRYGHIVKTWPASNTNYYGRRWSTNPLNQVCGVRTPRHDFSNV